MRMVEMGVGLYEYRNFVIAHVNDWYLVYEDHKQRVVGNFLFKDQDISTIKDMVDKMIIGNTKGNLSNEVQ